METLVAQHPNFLVLRLPQAAGASPNPHTLLNFLYARIARSEAFSVWRHAYRNILDVDDVARIADRLIADPATRRGVINLANPTSYSMPDIVAAMERVTGKPAIHELLERGGHYRIDVAPMLRTLAGEDIGLGGDYLDRVLEKYYGKA
jgi:nucleoside-diphosphate-sugar epimerase